MREDRRAAIDRHIAIAGAGVIGLACAIALRRRGSRVTVLDAGMAMKEASWAAGGMLAVDDPENPEDLLPLSRYSRHWYEQFLEEIETLSGYSVPMRTQETIQITDRPYQGSGRILSVQEARQRVPDLADTHGSLLLLKESSIDPRDLCTALPPAARAAGVEVREEERVLSVEDAGSGIRLRTTRGSMCADAFLNCCGAWTSSLWTSSLWTSSLWPSSLPASSLCLSSETPAGIRPRTTIRPRKGQMLVVAQPEGAPLACVLRSAEVYLIPRGDGRIAIGATVEDAGFSKAVDADALLDLRRRAAALWPPAMHAAMMESWAGLRPASADDLPVIGCFGGAAQFVAAGHYRNGILLAPGTARIIADLVNGDAPAIDISLFAPLQPIAATRCDKHFAPAL